jgi:hypothetical protein
MSQQGQAT